MHPKFVGYQVYRGLALDSGVECHVTLQIVTTNIKIECIRQLVAIRMRYLTRIYYNSTHDPNAHSSLSSVTHMLSYVES